MGVNKGRLELSSYDDTLKEHINQTIMLALEMEVTKINLEFLLYSLLYSHERISSVLQNVRAVFTENFTHGADINDLLEYLEETLIKDEEDGALDFIDFGAYTEAAAAVLQGAGAARSLASYVRALLTKTDALDQDIREALTDMLRIEKCAAAIARLEANDGDSADVFDTGGMLKPDAFVLQMFAMIEYALVYAAETGHDTVKPVHLFYAMLRDKDAYPARVCRRHQAGISADALRLKLSGLLSRGSQSNIPKLNAHIDSFSKFTQDVLKDAAEKARFLTASAADERAVFMQLLETKDHIFIDCLQMLDMQAAEMLEICRQMPNDGFTVSLPTDICEGIVLTERKSIEVIGRDDLLKDIIKTFLRKDKANVAIHGEPGVGKTALAQAITGHIKARDVDALKMMPVVYLDLESIPAHKLNDRVPRLFDYMDENENRIYILDGFGRIFLNDMETCRHRLVKNKYKVLCIMNQSEKSELAARKDDGSKYLNFLEVPEPRETDMPQILNSRITELEAGTGVRFEQNVFPSAIRFSSDYLISQKFPKKVFDLLFNTAHDVLAEAQLNHTEPPVITRAMVAAQVAQEVGLPLEVVMGTGDDKDYTYLLSKYVVGQEAAIFKVSERMDYIQKSLVDKKRPAAIFLFAGLSGTGKTELSKAIAQVYSTSHKLITYPMENCGEPHSVSRIIGSAPGLIGYDSGGPLINDINKDPYSVVLLDEVEKAHPAVWDPFLHLFDEGVITDQRGVSAYASKTFFIMTTNIGAFEITDMLQRGRPLKEIEEAVTKAVNTARFYRDPSLNCFRPEFVGRVARGGGIVAFNALSEEALTGVCRHMINNMIRDAKGIRDFDIIVDDDVIEWIGHLAFAQNSESIRTKSNYIGARSIQPIYDRYITSQYAANLKKFAKASAIHFYLSGEEVKLDVITGEDDAQKQREARRIELKSGILATFSKLGLEGEGAISGFTYDQMVRLDKLLAEAKGMLKLGKDGAP